jgi:hypothetical protein
MFIINAIYNFNYSKVFWNIVLVWSISSISILGFSFYVIKYCNVECRDFIGSKRIDADLEEMSLKFNGPAKYKIDKAQRDSTELIRINALNSSN